MIAILPQSALVTYAGREGILYGLINGTALNKTVYALIIFGNGKMETVRIEELTVYKAQQAVNLLKSMTDVGYGD